MKYLNLSGITDFQRKAASLLIQTINDKNIAIAEEDFTPDQFYPDFYALTFLLEKRDIKLWVYTDELGINVDGDFTNFEIYDYKDEDSQISDFLRILVRLAA